MQNIAFGPINLNLKSIWEDIELKLIFRWKYFLCSKRIHTACYILPITIHDNRAYNNRMHFNTKRAYLKCNVCTCKFRLCQIMCIIWQEKFWHMCIFINNSGFLNKKLQPRTFKVSCKYICIFITNFQVIVPFYI